MFLNGRRRWPFVLIQLAMLGAAIAFFIDQTAGGQTISFLVILTSVVALVLAFAPQCWDYVRRTPPRFVALHLPQRPLRGRRAGRRRWSSPRKFPLRPCNAPILFSGSAHVPPRPAVQSGPRVG